MSFANLNQWSIKKRILLLVMAPLVLIITLSTARGIYQSAAETRTDLLHIGSSAVHYIAVLAEFGMFAGNIQDLSKLAAAATDDPDIKGVVFLNAEKQILDLNQKDLTTLSVDSGIVEIKAPTQRGQLWYFSAPIKLSGVEFMDYAESSDTQSNEQIIGWVVLVMSEQNLINRQNTVIVTNLFLMAGAALFAGLLAWLLASDITRSLTNITRTVQKLTHGDFQARVTERSSGEMGELEQGINELAYRGQKNKQLLELDVVQATRKLRDAMVELEAHNTELEDARNKAEIANQAKDQFLARMSHELRTPLTTVLGFSKLLKKTGQSKAQAEHTQIIMQASTLLLSIIDDILEFSRLQSSTITLECINFNLENCLDEVIALHSLSAHEKQLELVLLIESDVPLHLRGDKLRLQQMISNLVSNALKFTARGHVVVLISVIEDRINDVELQLSVIDSGEGISAENIAHLFQPFTQADTSISRRHGGTGLGLVIVKSFAQLMHGSITINSEPGLSTEAILTVRCEKQSPESLMSRRLAFPPLNTVIVYDQNAWVRRSFRNRLRDFTRTIFVVARQNAVLELLAQRAEHCPLVILGFTVQECASDEFNAFLLEVRSKFSGTLMLVAGCSNMAEIVADSLQTQLQPAIFLSKPVAGRNLYAAIEKCVGQKLTSNGTTEQPTQLPPGDTMRSLQGLDILVAEDNELNLRLFRTVLQAEGAATWPAPNGAIALEACKAKTFDLILMDVHMPLIDGIEATRQIRRDNGINSKTPIIALTANVVDTEEQALREAGIASILYKPIDEEDLIANILHTVKRQDKICETGHQPAVTIAKDVFRAELIKHIRMLEKTLLVEDWIGVKDLAHQLRGLSGLTLVGHIPQITRDLDDAARQEDRDAVLEHLGMLKSAVDQIIASPSGNRPTTR